MVRESTTLHISACHRTSRGSSTRAENW